MNKQALIEKIEAWLDDDLPDEAASLQERAETDPGFRALVERVQARRSVVEAYQADHYLKKIEAWKEIPASVPEPESRTNEMWKIDLIAAAAMFLMFIFFNWIYHPTVPSPEERREDPGGATFPKKEQANNVENPLPGIAPMPGDEEHNQPILIEFSPATHTARIDTAYLNPSDSLKVVDEVYANIVIDLKSEVGEAISSIEFKGGTIQGSAYTQGLEYAKTVPDSAILILNSVAESNEFYYDAQKILAFLYARKRLYHEAAICYKRFDKRIDTPETDWLLVGFYLKDYKNSREGLLTLLDEIIKTEGGHKYKKEAELLKHRLNK